ncbi:hypothetical protein [Desulfofundulus sp.]|uniref:hypothetical protein n=1 Tax=Desulfofundulus sp. TaxID=2282750 RepID=UPI003C7697A4
MIKVRVIYASTLDLPHEEIELATATFVELQEKVRKKLRIGPLSFATSGNVIRDPETVLTDGQEIFVFPLLAGG